MKRHKTLLALIVGVLAISVHAFSQTTTMSDIFSKISSLFQQAAQIQTTQTSGTGSTTTTGTTAGTGVTTGGTGTTTTGSTSDTTGTTSNVGSTGSTGSVSGSATGGGTATSVASNISAVWANEGEDKVSKDELRASKGVENVTGTVRNHVWDGATISVFGAHNEIVSFNLVLEAASTSATNVAVSFDTLTGNGSTITGKQVSGDSVFDWTNRQIELFYARYVEIKGLSFFGYFKGDERQIPIRFQAASHNWTDRPDHNKLYPDALVPLELVSQFNISAGTNQSVWADIYIPKSAAPGVYTGKVTVTENGTTTKTIPVKLTVAGFTLPDSPTAKTFVNIDASDITKRYIQPDGSYIQWSSPDGTKAMHILDRYFELFHRHKIGVIGENDCGVPGDRPCPNAIPRLDGSLFTAANGYEGPGSNTGESTYSIGTYGTWGAGTYGVPAWKFNQSLFNQHIDAWQSWFSANLPSVEHFIYLADEPQSGSCNGAANCTDIGMVENWAKWVNSDPGVGKNLLSMSTYNFVPAKTQAPDLSVPTMAGGIGGCPAGQSTCDNTSVTQSAANYYLSTAGKRMWMYNDGRPGTGTLMTEADGTDPRTLPWAQMKMRVQRWFYWFGNVSCCIDAYQQARTWGGVSGFNGSTGETGGDGYSNGNGFLVYPGTDLANSQDSYNVLGPVASIRLKSWRRGVQDADYIALAQQINSTATNTIVNAAIPKALWENPAPSGDISYFNGPISWSSNPDDWESSRAALSQLITTYCASHAGTGACQ